MQGNHKSLPFPPGIYHGLYRLNVAFVKGNNNNNNIKGVIHFCTCMIMQDLVISRTNNVLAAKEG